MMKDKMVSPVGNRRRLERTDDGLGANSDIGAKLRALYGSVQDEGIPDRLLELLEKLDMAEQQNDTNIAQKE